MAPQVRVIFVALSLQLLAANAGADTAGNARPGCPDQCGNVNVPYPFGIGKDGKGNDCFWQSEFSIICDNSTTPVKPYLANSKNVEVTDISVVSGEISILAKMAVDCDTYVFSDRGRQINWTTTFAWTDLSTLPLTFSSTRNKFTAIGCDTEAFIGGKRGVLYAGGCISYCETTKGMENGTCSGQGCCETPIPSGVGMYNITIRSFDHHRQSWTKNRCSYAFVVENGKYVFQVPDLYDPSFSERRFPVVLDWSIGNMPCGPELLQNGNYTCRSKNSECVNSTRDVGYVCNCTKGYEGNPYLENGCQDINECEHPDIYPCNGKCKNTIGSYKCRNTRLYLVLGLGFGFLALMLLFLFALWSFQQKKLKKMKLSRFEKNGGYILRELISSYEGSTFIIFTEEELKMAEQRVAPDERIPPGEGTQATMSKGILEEGQEVFIKKFNMFDEGRSRDFVKEIVTLSRIDHKNVVKLLGCCLESEKPMLVYEFIRGGDLSTLIHTRERTEPISLTIRLSIAIDVADALTCLHSYQPPIFHGDIKSSNILPDENKIAKVTDFTASRLGPKDKKQFATMVQGTCGYMDPEYFQTSQLTAKSDVYSFGVVLVELLTGKEALVFEGPEEHRSLPLNFSSSVSRNRLPDLLDPDVARHTDKTSLDSIAELACWCLKMKGEDRPAMETVFMELKRIANVSGDRRVPYNPTSGNYKCDS